MDKNASVLIVGHNGIIEKALYQRFVERGIAKVFSSSLIGLDATIQPSVYAFFQKERPQYVFLGSTRSGGIAVNQAQPADFIYQNSEAQNNIIYSAWKFGVKKLLYVGASCVYPKETSQPIKEESLLTAPLEPTSEPYAVAKIAGIKMCQAYRQQYGLNTFAVVPATLYGPQREINAAESHVMGALIKKFTDAVANNEKQVTVWGTGEVRREFLYINDFVDALEFLADKDVAEPLLNVGSGDDILIRELARLIAKTVGFQGEILFDSTKPDGAKQKLLDSSKIQQLGWKPKVTLTDGINRCTSVILNAAKRSEESKV